MSIRKKKIILLIYMFYNIDINSKPIILIKLNNEYYENNIIEDIHIQNFNNEYINILKNYSKKLIIVYDLNNISNISLKDIYKFITISKENEELNKNKVKKVLIISNNIHIRNIINTFITLNKINAILSYKILSNYEDVNKYINIKYGMKINLT